MLVAGAFALSEAGRAMGEVGVNTIIVSRLGAGALPGLYVGLGLFTMALSLVYASTLARATTRRYFPALLSSLAILIGLLWLMAVSGIEASYPLVWISVYGSGLVLLMIMWSVSGLAFDTRQAKRLFPLIAGAAVAGNLAGLVAAVLLERVIGAASIILVEACLLLLAAGLIAGAGTSVRPRHAPGGTRPSLRAAATTGARYVAGSRLMKLLSLVFLLLTLTQYATIFPFMSAVGEAFPDEQDLLTVLAVFAAGVTVTSFAFGAFISNRLFDRLGILTVLMGLPLVYIAGFGLWIARFDLVTASIVRFGQEVSRHGFSNAALSAIFNVVPGDKRGQVLAFVDGVPGQVGTILAGLLLIIATSLSTDLVFWLGLVSAVIGLIVIRAMRRAYAETVVATLRELRSERFLEGGPGLVAMTGDPRVIDELCAATRSASASERILAADLLGRIGATSAVGDLRRLCGDEVAGVRRMALEGLVRLEGSGAVDDVRDALADRDAIVRAGAVASATLVGPLPAGGGQLSMLERDPDPAVRRQLVVHYVRDGDDSAAARILDEMLSSETPSERAAGLDALAMAGNRMEVEAARRYLEDPSGAVRASAIRALEATSHAELDLLVDHLDDPEQTVRAAAIESLRRHDDAPPTLVAVLDHGSEQACLGALAALAGRTGAVRPDLLRWSERQVDRALELRRYRTAFDSAAPGSAAEYLGAVVAMREDTVQSLLLHSISAMGTPEATGIVRRGLRAPDRETRAHAVEALDVLVEPRLSRRIVALLEPAASDGTVDQQGLRAAANELSGDQDPWVRALAFRTLNEDPMTDMDELVSRARRDSDPLVRTLVEPQEDATAMPDTVGLLSDIDRMLALRRVPLFETLAPEDLQRIAAAASVTSWAGGDVLMAQGDIGSELVVIVEGSVSVIVEEAGERRQVRTCYAGDHIGELAVLRDAPRSATVAADAGGVLGLVLDGEAVRALLLERPHAAMALLGTLAERAGR